MDRVQLRQLLEQVQQNRISLEEAIKTLEDLPYTDLGFAKVDSHRALRQGFPEVVYCAGKTVEQVAKIVEVLSQQSTRILCTRATEEMYLATKELVPGIQYNPIARTLTLAPAEDFTYPGTIAVISAGTSDLPVAEEAAITAEMACNKVERIYDVGVAGLHRLLAQRERFVQANVIIVVAGMEGALASVVGGLVDRPVIAVPTSVGYGASFGGLAALLSMLNSCAAGVSVVNIDNGFGAGFIAARINRLIGEAARHE
ncbi:MAG TPA: nickel pincer cofactor biosynthesis protein LarB [Firmicutes bacterium]|nr:nickel pincer cofactor biosynthesis protein LarB [Bacillota bacterium]